MKKRLLLLILFIGFVQELFGQCAMCKAVAEEQADQGPTGINTGILYIMIIPYIILFFVFRKKIIGFLRELREAKHAPIQQVSAAHPSEEGTKKS